MAKPNCTCTKLSSIWQECGMLLVNEAISQKGAPAQGRQEPLREDEQECSQLHRKTCSPSVRLPNDTCENSDARRGRREAITRLILAATPTTIGSRQCHRTRWKTLVLHPLQQLLRSQSPLVLDSDFFSRLPIRRTFRWSRVWHTASTTIPLPS